MPSKTKKMTPKIVQPMGIPAAFMSLMKVTMSLISWPINAVLRWHYGQRLELSYQYRRLRFWMMVVCVLDLLSSRCRRPVLRSKPTLVRRLSE